MKAVTITFAVYSNFGVYVCVFCVATCDCSFTVTVHTNSVYTDVNKTSIDMNKDTEERLRIIHLPAVNQRI
jgi:hypothetical protein